VIQGLWGNPFTVANLNSGTYGFATTGNTNTAILRNYNAGLGFSVLGSGSLTLDNGELWVTSLSTYTNPIVITSRGGILNCEQNQFYGAGSTVTGTGLLALEANNKQYFFTNDWSGFTGTLAMDANDTIVNFCSNSPACNLVFWGAYNATYGTLQWNGDATQPATLAFTRANSGSAAGIAGGVILTGRLSNGTTNTLTYKFGDNSATTNNFGALIQNGSGAVGITKIGSDTQILSAANTYTNSTYVGGGTLVLNGINNSAGGCVVSNGATLSLGGTGSLTNSTAAVTVQAGGTLAGGGGTIAGLVTLNSGNAAINLQDNIINTNTLSGGLTLNAGNVLNFDLGSGSDVIAITGGIYTKNAGTVTVNVSGTGFGANIYPLITGASISSTTGFVLGTVPSNPSFSYALVANSGNLALQVTVAVVSPATAYWKGSVNNNWSAADSGANFNWATTSAGTTSTGAKPGVTTAVTFSATGAANQATVLGGNFEINSLALTTSANVGIGGANTLQLDSGGLTINSGAGNLTVSNSSLVLGGVQLWTNSSANTVTVSAPISGLSSVTLGGGNTVWSGANSHAGTTVSGGKLTLSGSGTLGSGSANVTANGSSIDLGGSGQNVGAVSLVNGSTITNGTITGSSYDLESGTIAAVVGGSGGATAVKTTASSVVLSANNTFSGTMLVTNGTLQIGAGGVTGSLSESALVVSNGASVVFNSSGSQTNSGLISGFGSLTVVGGGSVLLNNGLSTFTGNILIDGGSTLAAQGGNSSSVGSLGNPGAFRTIITTNGSKLTFIAGNIYGNGAASSCKISTVISSNCQFVLNANDANIIGPLELDGGTLSVGNGFSSQYQAAILLSNVVIGGTSPSTILATGTDATKNGVMLGAFGTVASADIINNSLHFLVNSTGGSGADLTVSARLVDPPYSGSVGGGNTSANGSLYKDGSGIMLLTAANTYTGPTVVNAGKLVVSSVQGAAGMTNYVDVIDGAALAVLVSGTNQWSPSLAYLGTGGGGITLEFTNLNTPNIAPFNPGSVSVPGPLTVNVSGKVSAAQYRLVANAAGSIGSFSIGTLPSGVVASLVADTDGTTIDLNVSTGNAGPSGAGTITNSISGSNLTLTWPSGQGWRLVSQTNSLSVGLTASGWNTVSGGIDGSNSFAIDPTKPTVFYRLTYP
jgi:autotransporter-associated beta strand protein